MPITDPISRTSRLTAAARARESRRADRLFFDPFAAALAGDEGVALMERLEAAAMPPGSEGRENPYIAIRTRFFDDLLTKATSASGVRQVVLVAAGLDTRAFRMEWPSGTRLFELDRPEVLASKADVLSDAGARPACDMRAVGVDLASSWESALLGSGYDPGSASVWLAEGLTPYLDEAVARRLFERIAGVAAAGSQLAADVMGKGFLTSPFTQTYLAALAREGAPWRFGTDEPEAFLDAVGWEAAALPVGGEGASYGRWPYPVFTRGTPDLPISFFVTAIRR